MKLLKKGRKWIVEGDGEGWIFNKRFPSKWKAEIALRVFENGGRVSDYWKEARRYAESRPAIEPKHVLKKLESALEEIRELDPTCDEIEEFGKDAGYGIVTITEEEDYYEPHLHNTWGRKYRGRVHIDIGCRGYHLMLDKRTAPAFIEFIRHNRKSDIKL
jgi:hypothetical protein